MNKVSPYIIKGGSYTDERGGLEFYKDFDMAQIKRMYFGTHCDSKVIRAWQGHTIQSPWFLQYKVVL